MPKAMQQAGPKRILLVEDEYMIAQDMAYEISAFGAEVVGPVPSLGEALRLVEAEAELDAAFLDLNLNGEQAYPLVDALRGKGVPIVFTTGYDENVIPPRYADIPRCGKPVTRMVLRRMLGTIAG
jgi:CheY-like chemotaxis protein